MYIVKQVSILPIKFMNYSWKHVNLHIIFNILDNVLNISVEVHKTLQLNTKPRIFLSEVKKINIKKIIIFLQIHNQNNQGKKSDKYCNLFLLRFISNRWYTIEHS